MKKLYILIVMGLSILLGLQSCKPDDNTLPDPYFVPTPQPIKDYTFFKNGSWWVYHDSANNIYDTVTVTELNQGIDTFRKDGKVQFYYDWFTLETYSSYFKYYFKYTYGGSWPNLVWRTKYKPGHYVGATFCFLNFPKGTKRAPYTQDGIVTFIDSLQNLKINNTQFISIYQFEDSENITEDKRKTNFYFAKNVGIIRKVIADTTVWNLIDYNISQ